MKEYDASEDYQKRSDIFADEAVFKILYLALRNISKQWIMPIQNGIGAMNQFAILFENRLPNGSLTNKPFTQTF